ncbi:hypothetical protein [Solibacillus sp. FSL H8-0538]|uniref:hypothetical protein n=1 Tax=Solibacillus sp. FSL H8-0538 TaxID=2921400 RepID=UPI0030F835B8
MTQIPSGASPYFEAGIYLPMLLIILEKDYLLFEQGNFKFKKPYLHLLNETKTRIEQELKKTKAYFNCNQMRLTRGNTDEFFTEYLFYYKDFMECRRYSNIRLRNFCEQLLIQYMENR